MDKIEMTLGEVFDKAFWEIINLVVKNNGSAIFYLRIGYNKTAEIKISIREVIVIIISIIIYTFVLLLMEMIGNVI